MTQEQQMQLTALMIGELTQVKARSEILLVTLAKLMAQAEGTDWKPVLAELRDQVSEAQKQYAEQIQARFDRLMGNPPDPGASLAV